MCYRRETTPEEKQKIIEVYHSFPTKEITREMLIEARRRTCRGLMDCKRIIQNYINETYGKDR